MGTGTAERRWFLSIDGQWRAYGITTGVPSGTDSIVTAAFTSALTGRTVILDASPSTVVGADVAAYSWDFGDGSTGTGVNPSHTYLQAGSYTVALTVTDTLNHSDTVTKGVTISAPIAAYTWTSTGTTANFDASTTTSVGSPITTYGWDFGDGATASGPVVSHTYTAAGTRNVVLTVTDQNDNTDTDTQSVSVALPVSNPIAVFTVLVTNQVASFDASSSSTTNATITGYAWAYGDGSTGTGQKTTHTYTVGSYTAVLTITDSQGHTDQVSHPVTVAAPANQPPVAAFTVTPTGLSVNFSGVASTDGDGSISSYAWMSGDGGTGTGVNWSHTYAAGGSYTVRLTVTDNLGAQNSTTKTVTVTDPSAATTLLASTTSSTSSTLNPQSTAAVLQQLIRSPDTGEFYVTQRTFEADGVTETVRLERLTASGTLIDAMRLTAAGHGSTFALEYTGGQVYVWLNWRVSADGASDAFDIVRFPYQSGGGTYTRSQVPGLSVPIRGGTTPATAKIIAVGDSITYGQDGGGTTWPGTVGTQLTVATVNPSRPGWTSLDMAVKMGAVDPGLTFPSNTIPASGTVTLTAISPAAGWRITGGIAQTYTGTVAGVAGTLKHTADTTTWTFTRTTAGSTVTTSAGVKFHCTEQDGNRGQGYDLAVMLGRNDFSYYPDTATLVDAVGGNIDAIVARFTPNRVLVLGTLSLATATDRDKVRAFNKALADRYGTDFLDPHTYLSSTAALTAAGITPTATDTADINSGWPATSLTGTTSSGALDRPHLNAAGYTVLGKYIAARMNTRGWKTTPTAAVYRLMSFDWEAGLACIRTATSSTETFTRYPLANILAGQLTGQTGATITVPSGPPTPQGFAIYADSLFRYTGAPRSDPGWAADKPTLTELSWKTGGTIRTVDMSGYLGGGEGEPEGLSVYNTGTNPVLFFGISLGPVGGPHTYPTWWFPLVDTSVTASQPTGAGITRYQDTTGSGFVAKVSSAPTSNSVSFPPGTFEFFNFSDATYYGLVYDGRGLLGSGVRDTVIRMTASTSTKASLVPSSGTVPLYLIRSQNTTTGVKYDGFHLQGTPQGHIYNGLRVSSQPAAVLSNMKVSAVPGNDTGPPGETFLINVANSSGTTVTNLECDGATVAATGLSYNSSSGGSASNFYGHNMGYCKDVAFWKHTGGFRFDNSIFVNSTLGPGFEECGGTYTFNKPTFGGHHADIHIGSSGKVNAPAKIVINDPILIGQTQITVFCPATYNGNPTYPGVPNAQTIADVKVFVGGVDKSSTMVKQVSPTWGANGKYTRAKVAFTPPEPFKTWNA